MRVLCVTRIFPNRVEPSFGPYNQKQLAALSTLGWDVSVINPIPWFPGAGILLGKLLNVPVVVKLHGGDMNVAAKAPPVGRWIRWGFERVSRIVAVSYPLAEAAHGFGVPWSRLVVVEDGVDSHVFRVRDKAEA